MSQQISHPYLLIWHIPESNSQKQICPINFLNRHTFFGSPGTNRKDKTKSIYTNRKTIRKVYKQTEKTIRKVYTNRKDDMKSIYTNLKDDMKSI